MSGFAGIYVDIVVCINGTTNWSNKKDIALNIHFINYLSNELMNNSVSTATTVMSFYILH